MDQIGLFNQKQQKVQTINQEKNFKTYIKIQENRPANLTVSKVFSDNQKWRQCKVIGRNISIRSYAASCAFQGKFYIYGGYQILNGSLSDFYSIDLKDDQPKFVWNQIIPKSQVNPGARSKHCLVATRQKIYLIGGLHQDVNSSKDIYQFNPLTQIWTLLKPDGLQNFPKLDSFGCVLMQKQGLQTIYIVGGYNGQKAAMQNAIYEFIPSKNIIINIFKNVSTKSQDIIHIRCGHSVATDSKNIYIFGGKNQDQRFNDIWQFNLTTLNYQRLPNEGDVPAIRNGHTMNFYNNRLYVFGGIHDITWELDDLHIYNLNKKSWTTLQQDSPRRVEKKSLSPEKNQEKSLQKKNNKKKNWYQSMGGSLNVPNKSAYSSPINQSTQGKNFNTVYHHSKQKTNTKIQQQEPAGNMLDQQRRKVFYQKKAQMLKNFQVPQKQKQKLILFQTNSQAMRNSLDVIGNPSGKPLNINSSSMTNNNEKLTQFGKQTHSKFLAPLENDTNLIIGKKPCARDGHCSVMLNDQLIIFGGDRHQMSFNDIYKLNFSLAQKQSDK